MATNLLDKIAAMSDQLALLGGKQRGQRIEADDWNSLIAVLSGVLQVERAQEDVVNAGLDQNYARKDHTHIGDVTLDWLDPSLKAVLGSGSGAVAIRSALDDTRKLVGGLSVQVATLTTVAQSHQKQLDQSAVDEVNRANVLNGFDKRFAGLADLQTSVISLSGQVQGLSSNINTVLDLRKSLTDPSGAPIDVSKLRADVNDLATLKTNLTGVDGTLVRVRDFETQIKALQDAVGVSGSSGLDGRISASVGEAEKRIGASVSDQISQARNDIQTTASAGAAQLRQDLTAQVTASGASLQQATDAKIAEAETRINTRTDTQIGLNATALKADVLAATSNQIDQRFAVIPNLIASAIFNSENTLQNSFGSQLTAAVSAAIQAQSDTLAAQLAARQAAVDAKLSAIEAGIPVQVAQAIANLKGGLTATFNQQLTQSFTDFQTTFTSSTSSLVTSSVAAALAGLPQQIASTVQTQLGDLDARVRTAVTSATSNLPDLVKTLIQTVITGLNIPQQIQTLGAGIVTQFRGDLNQGLANLRAQQSSELSGAISALRTEFITTRVITGRTVIPAIEKNVTPG